MRQTFPIVFLLITAAGPSFADEPTDLVKPEVLQTLIQQVNPSVATIRVSGRDGEQIGMGTGFVIASEGLIATNFHVITEGRPFTVEMSSGRKLPVLAIESSDRNSDLALLRVDVGETELPALALSDDSLPSQGSRVLAFGNPLGMRDSVVTGIVSAIQEIDDRKMIQLAIPTQPGNSGGPLIDSKGQVIGIINMKSAIDDNLGFAIPINQLNLIRESTNPVAYERWVNLGLVNEKKWLSLFNATWKQRGGMITARGVGTGFGGRSLCLSKSEPPGEKFEVAVRVRLDDESGAAGIVFHSDGDTHHYGFYPSNGQLRLTCFKGPSVYSWEVLKEVQTKHYLPNQWNHLRVRIQPGKLQCFVNDHLVIESDDAQLVSGNFGLVKFRNTNPDFKGFEFGSDLQVRPMTANTRELLENIFSQPTKLRDVTPSDIQQLGESDEASSREIKRKVAQLEKQSERLRRLAADVTLAPVIKQLRELVNQPADGILLRGSLLIAKLDDPDIDVNAYVSQVDEMGHEITATLPKDADEKTKRETLHAYLFEENGFHGGRAEYYHPANSHLNRVIDEREGLPITLSILYMELARRIGIRTEGVGLPGHFVVNHVMDNENQQLVDVFEQGELLTRDDAARIVATHSNRSMIADDLRAQTPVEILSRVLNNLIGVAGNDQNAEAINRYCEASVAIQPDSIPSRRMRSQIRAMTGRYAAAIEDLDWLIDNDNVGFAQSEATRLRQAVIKQAENE